MSGRSTANPEYFSLNSQITFTVGELSKRLGTTLIGNPDIEVNHIAPVESAGPASITFVTGSKFLGALQLSNPTAVILNTNLREETGIVRLLSDDPYRSYAKLSRIWADRLQVEARGSVHETAAIEADVELSPGVTIGANAVVGCGAALADDVTIGAGSYIGAGVQIESGTHIHPNVTVLDRVTIGAHCELHSGAVVGADGFGWAPADGMWEKICQLGSVRIGNRVSIGACTTVDRGAIEDTVIEDGVILDNHIQVAHNVVIGENTAIAGCTGIAGSTRIGRNCRIGGAVSIVGHISICDQVTITANSFVNSSIRSAGSYSSGYPVEESKKWRKNAVR